MIKVRHDMTSTVHLGTYIVIYTVQLLIINWCISAVILIVIANVIHKRRNMPFINDETVAGVIAVTPSREL